MATTQSVAPPPGSSPEYSGDRLIIFTAIFLPVQVLCVALRYLTRYLIKGAWGLDDAVTLSSLLLQLCMAGISIGEQSLSPEIAISCGPTTLMDHRRRPKRRSRLP